MDGQFYTHHSGLGGLDAQDAQIVLYITLLRSLLYRNTVGKTKVDITWTLK